MGKCRSSQQILAEHILHEKWLGAMTAWLVEECEVALSVADGQSAKERKRVSERQRREFEELTNEKAQKEFRFQRESLLRKHFLEAYARAKKILGAEFQSNLDELTDSLRDGDARIDSWFRQIDG